MWAKKEARKERTDENIETARFMTHEFHWQARQAKAQMWKNYLKSFRRGGIWRAAKYCPPTNQAPSHHYASRMDGECRCTGRRTNPASPPSKSTPLDYTLEVDEK